MRFIGFGWIIITIILAGFNGFEAKAQEVRLKDITNIQGVRDNQLTGLGLVTGLNGTGDGTAATRTALVNVLRKNNLSVDTSEISVGNVALVLVTATLPPFSRCGNRIDVTVTSVGDAKSLYGGTLLQTPLRSAASRDTYAVAQGSISIGGFSATGNAASVTKNHDTVGIIPDGAIIEKEVAMKLLYDERRNSMLFTLKNPDFTTAVRIAEAINGLYESHAKALDMKSVEVQVPKEFDDNITGFVSQIHELKVRPGTQSKVIINERTGTILAGADVRISTVAITHGNLIITIAENPEVSQPSPFSENGETVIVDRTDVNVTEEPASFAVIPGNSSVSDLAQALNAIGATPRDLVVIFQLIKRAGALHADLELM
ncbi:MAG: flagellar basal body P-ring protein FlgI [Planctomycetes bacterium]|nr:flagellar basal body P-ring protein FlgI [Planctomycetota bacterium]